MRTIKTSNSSLLLTVILSIIIIQITLAELEESKRIIKRNAETDIQSTVSIKKSDESESVDNEEQHEFERVTVIQNLNYLDDILTTLNEEKQKLEEIWKNDSVDVKLKNASKVLWNRTNNQINLLNNKKYSLMDTLKKMAFDDSTDDESDNSTETISTTTKAAPVSKAICQFFVFGTLFGVVVTITICSCFLQPKNRRNRHSRVSSVSNLNPSRIPEPFDTSKPCFLKADSNGKFYASPIDCDEIPPLPTYEAALNLPRNLVVLPKITTNSSTNPSTQPSIILIDSPKNSSSNGNVIIERY